VELIFAESKLYADFSSGLESAFSSMTEFYRSPTKVLEKSYFTNGFSETPESLQDLAKSFFEGENLDKSREVYACLVGFDWNQYECLADQRRAEFVKEFKDRYTKWAKETMQLQLEKRIAGFPHKHLRLEFFFVPFKSVAEFRLKFLESL
jgi:cyclopropane fatty-acyl-phospholipid synthase-like methyltransferase